MNGTTSWSGNTLTFTPTSQWDGNATFTVQLPGVQNGPLSYSFSTDYGYVFDTSFSTSALASLPVLSGDSVRYANTPFAVDQQDNVLVVDANNADPQQVLVFDSTGAADGTINIPDTSITVDSNDYIWGFTSSGTAASSTNSLHKYDHSGNVSASIDYSLDWTGYNSAIGGPYASPVVLGLNDLLAVDALHNVAYAFDATAIDLSTSSTSTAWSNEPGMSTLQMVQAKVAVDPTGIVYALWVGEELYKISPDGTFLNANLSDGGMYQVENGAYGPTVDASGNMYFLQQAQPINSLPGFPYDYILWKFDASGRLLTHFRIAGSTLNPDPQNTTPAYAFFNIAVDSAGRIYIDNGNQFMRFVPQP